MVHTIAIEAITRTARSNPDLIPGIHSVYRRIRGPSLVDARPQWTLGGPERRSGEHLLRFAIQKHPQAVNSQGRVERHAE